MAASISDTELTGSMSNSHLSPVVSATTTINELCVVRRNDQAMLSQYRMDVLWQLLQRECLAVLSGRSTVCWAVLPTSFHLTQTCMISLITNGTGVFIVIYSMFLFLSALNRKVFGIRGLFNIVPTLLGRKMKNQGKADYKTFHIQ